VLLRNLPPSKRCYRASWAARTGALDEAQGRLLRQPRHREAGGSKVVQLAKEAGVALTPAGATYPSAKDPNNRNIRISPTRPPFDQVRKAMEVVAVCIQLASKSLRCRE